MKCMVVSFRLICLILARPARAVYDAHHVCGAACCDLTVYRYMSILVFGGSNMANERKMIAVPIDTWRKLRLLAAETDAQMGQIVKDLIDAAWLAHVTEWENPADKPEV